MKAAPPVGDAPTTAEDYFVAVERKWEAELRAFFERQERAALERMKSAGVRKGTRHWDPPGDKATDPSRLLDLPKWNRELRKIMEPLIEQVYEQSGDSIFDAVSAAGVFDVHTPGVEAALKSRLSHFDIVNRTTRNALVRTLTEGEASGESIGELADRIRHVFGVASRSRAVTIARTEVPGAVNEAQHHAARQTKKVVAKQWLAGHDGRTRDSHARADRQMVKMSSTFTVGRSQLRWPGDPQGLGEETINCRCTLLYLTEVPSGVTLV